MKKSGSVLLLWLSLLAAPVLKSADPDGPAPLPDLPPVPIPGAAPLGAEPGARVTSQSGQFRVQGGDQSQRNSLALLLDDDSNALKALLGEKKEPDKAARNAPPPPNLVPIDVYLDSKPMTAPEAQPISYNLSFTDTGFLLAMRLNLSRGINQEDLQHAALTLLLYERSLRGLKPSELEDRLVIRPWLVEGLMEAQKWNVDGHGDWHLYEGVMKAGGGFTLNEMFTVTDEQWRALDPGSRMAFRAMSGATVMSLLAQDKGDVSLRSFLGEAARNPGETPVIMRKHFPGLNLSEKSMAKWVQLKLLEIAHPDLTEPMSIGATETALEDALRFHYHDKDGGPLVKNLDAWQEIAAMKPAERQDAVRTAQEALVRLSYRCFPSYRDSIAEYQNILKDLAKGETKKIESRLLVLTEDRQVRKQRSERARDYLDYFEISRAREVSGEFDDYIKLKRELDERSRQPRTDRMSRTLDMMDTIYDPKPKSKAKP